MIDDDPDLERRYRSPRAFGPMPGPRNIPFSQRDGAGRPDEVTTSLSVSLEADPAELVRLLPPETQLSAATLTVTATRFENLLWLAGRGYPILTVTIPIEYVGDADGDAVRGRYLAVLWEGLADPITTGREELGFPKLFADIRAPRIADVSAAGVDADASWDGFRFLDMTADGLHDVPPSEAAPAMGTLVHRYVPALGAPGHADIDHLVYHPRAGGGAKRPTVTHLRRGIGRFSFHHARFADVPVQYPVINALAALSLGATGLATLTRTTAAPGNVPGAAAPRLLGGTTRQQHVAGVAR